MVVIFFTHEEKEVETMPPAGRRGAGAAFLPLSGAVSLPETLGMKNGHQLQPVP